GGNPQAAGPQELDEGGGGGVGDFPACVHHEELRPWRALSGPVGGDHRVPPADDATACGSAAAMTSASSRAAASGRFRVAGSASGAATAGSGVSRCPGSSDGGCAA